MSLRASASILVFFLGCVSACSPVAANVPSSLRSGIDCDQATITLALELSRQGWMYAMPQPKSPQAAWGHYDGRTTWWIGYWMNPQTNATSLVEPRKDSKGIFSGDGLGGPRWRRGGSPAPPTKLEWLCSRTGGVPPR